MPVVRSDVKPVEAALRAAIQRHGPVGFDVLVDVALYHPGGGFYVAGGRAGRSGDFITSPEVGPLFGALVARALDGWWVEAGEPEVFTVIEAGAGPGTLARTVLHAQPACRRALRYVLVEAAATQRATHRDRLRLEDAATAFAEVSEPDDEGRPRLPVPAGPIVVSMERLPRTQGPCVVLANELLDNLPFRLAERVAGGWAEVRVGVDGAALSEVLVPLERSEASWLDARAPDAIPGARVPMQRAAAAWLRDA
ncbi:MAG: SAM-dependent methyltransferase, partial [Acidimicrobiales bacterium]